MIYCAQVTLVSLEGIGDDEMDALYAFFEDKMVVSGGDPGRVVEAVGVLRAPTRVGPKSLHNELTHGLQEAGFRGTVTSEWRPAKSVFAGGTETLYTVLMP